MKKCYERQVDDIVGRIWIQAQKLFRDFKQADDITCVVLRFNPRSKAKSNVLNAIP